MEMTKKNKEFMTPSEKKKFKATRKKRKNKKGDRSEAEKATARRIKAEEKERQAHIVDAMVRKATKKAKDDAEYKWIMKTSAESKKKNKARIDKLLFDAEVRERMKKKKKQLQVEGVDNYIEVGYSEFKKLFIVSIAKSLNIEVWYPKVPKWTSTNPGPNINT